MGGTHTHTAREADVLPPSVACYKPHTHTHHVSPAADNWQQHKDRKLPRQEGPTNHTRDGRYWLYMFLGLCVMVWCVCAAHPKVRDAIRRV